MFDIQSIFGSLDATGRTLGRFPDVQTVSIEEADYAWRLKGGNYNKFDRKGNIVNAQLSDFEMPKSSIVLFTRRKVLTTTAIGANYGSVKEMYGFEDWQISIRGVLLPQEVNIQTQQSRLQAFEQLADSIEVEGAQFEERLIDHIIIQRLDFAQQPGRPGMLAFEMDCVSDQALELLLNI